LITEKMLCEAAEESGAAFLATIESDYEPGRAYTPSPEFERKIKRLCRRARHPYLRRAMQRVASVALAIIVAGTAWLAIDTDARAAVISWVREVYESSVIYRFSGEASDEQIFAMPQYAITDLPAGYSAVGEPLELPGSMEIEYENESGQILRFEYAQMAKGQALIIDTENMTVTDVSISGCPGQLYISTEPDQSNAVVWMDEQSNLQFVIDGFVGEQELLHIAESVSLVK